MIARILPPIRNVSYISRIGNIRNFSNSLTNVGNSSLELPKQNKGSNLSDPSKFN